MNNIMVLIVRFFELGVIIFGVKEGMANESNGVRNFFECLSETAV